MFGFEFKIDKVISTHSFDRYQMSVVTISNKKGELFNGIAIFPIPVNLFEEYNYIEANGLLGKPLVVEKSQTIRICQFLRKVLDGDLRGQLEFSSGGLDIKIRFKKFIENYHGGGGYKGAMGYSNFCSFGFLPRVTISRSSLIKFRASLVELYQLDDQAA